MKKTTTTKESDSTAAVIGLTAFGIACAPICPIAPLIGFLTGLAAKKEIKRDVEKELDKVVGNTPDGIAETWAKSRAEGVRHAEVSYSYKSPNFDFPITRTVKYELEDGEKYPVSSPSTPAVNYLDLVSSIQERRQKPLSENFFDWKLQFPDLANVVRDD